ncbi:MAG: lamin tail domain-containing protein, partial [Flavobacteriales bacterium]
TSFSRLPDGGPALNLASFVLQAPTPGATNGEPVVCLAGTLSTQTSLDNICIETLPNIISANMTGAAGNVIYALTSGDQVVDTSSTGVFVSSNLVLGNYQIWGIAYTENLVLEPGLAVASIGADCISFSMPVSFIVQDCLPNCSGGILSWSADTSTFCLDALPTNISLAISGGAGTSLYIVSAGGVITSTSNGALDLSGYAAGTYQITAVSYDGNLLEATLLPGASINAITGDGCIAFSTTIDFTIIDCSIPCQVISFSNDMVDVCVEDENSLITWNAIGTGNIIYVLTNESDIVISLLENSLDYSVLDPGIYKVFAAAYDETMPAVNAGQDIFSITSDQCFDVDENPKVIQLNDCFAPCQIDGFTSAPANTVLCIEDGAADIVLTAFPNAQGTVKYFLTDANGIILGSSPNQLSTAGLPEGDYLVVAVAYLGELAADSLLVGSLIDTIHPTGADSCITFASGPFSFSIQDCYPNCLAEGVSVSGQLNQCDQINYAPLEFYANSLFGGLAVYRTDAAGNIIEALNTTSFDANDLASGTYYFQAIAYSGTLNDATTQPGNPVSAILSSDCVSFFDSTFTLSVYACELTAPCSELFFSEYLAGSSFNKAIEIYNPTPFAVDLAAYKVEGYNNGADSSASNTLALTGILESGEVYVIANGQASPGILAIADTTSSVANFNGDDAIVLV